MAVITMHSMNSLVDTLANALPNLSFTESDRFAWNPQQQTIFYVAGGPESRLLHEVGHALLGHEQYRKDVELLKMETDAWQRAKDLSAEYGLALTEDEIDEHMESYREWLHARSTCPHCEATGVQIAEHTYSCLECGTRWRVNEARTCGLKRYVEQ